MLSESDMTSTANSTRAPCSMLFSIPLIVDVICLHLSTREIYRCCLVSRDLYNTFSPSIFTTINIQRRMTFNKWARSETQATLSLRLRTIKSITSIFGDTYQHLEQLILRNSSALHHLTELRCHIPPASPSGRVKNIHHFSSVLSLIEQSPSLQLLELDFFDFENTENIERLTSAIRKKGRTLRRLQIISTGVIRNQHIHNILWSSAAVRSITLGSYMYAGWVDNIVTDEQSLRMMAMEALLGGNIIEAKAPPHSRIQNEESGGVTLGPGVVFEWRELHLEFGFFQIEDIRFMLQALRFCPSLESFTMPGTYDSVPMQDAISAVSTVSLPRLQHLFLHYVDTYSREDQTVAHLLIESCSDLKSVTLGPNVRLPQRAIKSLVLMSGHSLEKVTLLRSHTLRSLDILRILTSCPRLKSFEALRMLRRDRMDSAGRMWLIRCQQSLESVLHMKDIQTSELGSMEWACKDLETLRICYQNTDDCIDIPGFLRQRIAELTKLKDLRLYCHSKSCTRPDDQNCVQEALREWSTLTELKTLELRGLKPLVDRKELVKIRKQWTKLEWIQFS